MPRAPTCRPPRAPRRPAPSGARWSWRSISTPRPTSPVDTLAAIASEAFAMLRSLLALTLAAQLVGTAALAAPSGDPGAPDPVAECDRLAASPRDPQRVG